MPNNRLDDQLEKLVRDVTQVTPRAKPEVEQRIKNLILQREAELLQRFIELVEKEEWKKRPNIKTENHWTKIKAVMIAELERRHDG